MRFSSKKLLNTVLVFLLSLMSLTVFFVTENLTNSFLLRIVLALDASFLICNIALATRLLIDGYADFIKMVHHKNEEMFLSTVFVLSPVAFSDVYLNKTGKMLRESLLNNLVSFVLIVMINVVVALLLINLIHN